MMEWHESLRQLLSGAHEEEKRSEESKQPSEQHVADLLVVDNAKPHRSLHESQNTVAETQVSPGSSIDEDELSVLFEEVDLYDDGEDEGGADFHHSFPVTQPSSHRRRRRRRANASITSIPDPDSNNVEMLTRWGSQSDSMIDYNSLDDMLLREVNSQTSSARLNVFRPARRRSVEPDFSDVLDMSETTADDDDDDDYDEACDLSDMDSKLAAVDKSSDNASEPK